MGNPGRPARSVSGETMFNLTKWYCDCVGDDGAAFLGYWAQLRRGPFTIPYSATLYKPAHGSPREHATVRHCPPPVLDGCFSLRVQRLTARELAASRGVGFRFVECRIDPRSQEARLALRDGDAAQPGWPQLAQALH